MSEKNKKFVVPSAKNTKVVRNSIVSATTTGSRSKVNSTVTKDKNLPLRPKINKNATVLGEGDNTILKTESNMPDFDAEYRQIAYGKFLRAMLEECLVDEKVEREQTEMDCQMSHLAERFQKTMETLDKTNQRLKEISFVAEQKRLLDLKSRDSSHYYESLDKYKTKEIVNGLKDSTEACLGRLETRNVDFGYNKDSGHKQLLDAVNDAIQGLEQVKKHSNLDINKFKEYEKTQKSLEELQKDRFELESLKTDFDTKFPKISEKLLKEASEKIANMIDADDD